MDLRWNCPAGALARLLAQGLRRNSRKSECERWSSSTTGTTRRERRGDLDFLSRNLKGGSPSWQPKGFESKEQRANARSGWLNSRKRTEREIQKQREANLRRQEMVKQGAFLEFWESMGPDVQAAFERDAIVQSEPTKRAGFERAKQGGGPVFEQYRDVILRDHLPKQKNQATRSRSAHI